MQDNLEFLQWIKKYWDMHFPGGEYDAVGRRKGVAAERTFFSYFPSSLAGRS